MLALGAIVGALCAHAGLAPIAQIIIAAALGSAFVLACYLVRRRQPSRQPASSNRDVNLDIGESVMVEQWNSDRSEEHTSELQSQSNLVCRLLLEKKKN